MAEAESILRTPNPVGTTTRVELAPNPDTLGATESLWRPLELVEPAPRQPEPPAPTEQPVPSEEAAPEQQALEQSAEGTNDETKLSPKITPTQQNHPNMLN
jgi:hypothetical protein